MKKTSRLIAAAALLLVISVAVPRTGVRAAVTVSTWAELQAELSSQSVGIISIKTIQLTADIKAGPDDTVLVIGKNKMIALDLNGHILDRGLTEATDRGSVLYVNEGGNLIIGDSNPSAVHDPAVTYVDPVKGETVTVTGGIITGGNHNSGGGGIVVDGFLKIGSGTITCNVASEGGGVRVNDKGTLILDGGSISGNTVTVYDGGGICSTGSVTIESGTVSGNLVTNDDPDGGGIYNSGTLEINGGTISRNKAGWGGGFINRGDLLISGGTVTENKATETGGGFLTMGNGTVKIKGGNITKNEAKQGGGIQISGGTVTMTGGTISYNKALENGSYTGGGGVKLKNSAVFNMEGGTISNNEAVLDGGGVCTMATFHMTGGTITGNKAKYAGGVYVEYSNSSFEMSGGTISENEAQFLAGGVYVQNTCNFTMTGGKIINNTVLTRDGGKDGQGGGIFVYNGGSLKISGGTISGNKAPFQGGGIYSWVEFDLSGKPQITENTVNGSADDVFLKFSQNIKVSGKLTGTVGVKADDLGYVITSGLSGNGNASNFRSNVPGYSIGLNGDGEAIFKANVYDVEIDAGMSNGTVETDKTSAACDDTVTLTVKPATGYELDKLTVKKGNDEVSVSGADNSYTFRMPAGDVTVSATFKLKTFTVTWIIDGKEEYETYTYGETPSYKNGTPVKGSDAQYTYTFKEWTPAFVTVTQDAAYTAVFDSTLNKYEISFVNDDGSKLQSSEVEYGKVPKYAGEEPTKTATAQYSYRFAGWKDAKSNVYTNDVPSVTGKATYTATYTETVNKYKITFVNEDGSELQSSDVEYGKVPEYTGEEPSKTATAQYSYSFAGWKDAKGNVYTNDVPSVTGKATYTATYTETLNKYTITFVNDDGSELQSSEVAYGETPAYTGKTPVKAEEEYYSYTFAKWSPDIVPVTGKATYTAVYDAVEKPAYAVAEGGDAELTIGEEKDLVITVERLPDDTTCFGHFTGVQIDGSDLEKEDYDAAAGSTVVTLKAETLQKLSAGTHTVTVIFDDGKAETKLTVVEKPTEPETEAPTEPETEAPTAPEIPDAGDNSRPGLWISLAALSVLGSAVTLCCRKRSGAGE